MAREIRIVPDARFLRWIANFDAIGAGQPIPASAVREWEIATEMMFAATQQYAHVDSGDMLSSGKIKDVKRDGTTLVGEIQYGGTRKSDAKPWWKHQYVDYTKYELKRGASHDFMKRASKATHKRLQHGAGTALIKIFEDKEW